MILLRKFILVSLFTLGYSLSTMYLVCPILGIQVLYIPLIIYIKANRHFHINLIEILNEMTYTTLAWMLIYYNTSDTWNSFATNLYCSIIFADSLAVLLIYISKSIFMAWLLFPNVRILIFCIVVKFKNSITYWAKKLNARYKDFNSIEILQESLIRLKCSTQSKSH